MKKWIISVLILIGCLQMVFAPAPACPDGMNGTGTLANPCQIVNWTNLQAMNNGLGYNYTLMNNLSSSTLGYSLYQTGAGFQPVGTSSLFEGTFDGQGYTITGLYINRSTTDFVGLFSKAGYCNIKNVNLKDVKINGHQNVGGLIGLVNCNVINSSSSGIVNATAGYAGGLIGVVNGVRVADSYSSANVYGGASGSYIGGLVGVSQSGQVINCYATGNAQGFETVGGLVGFTYLGGIINNSYATGSVTPVFYGGGLVGYAQNGAVVNSFASGTVSGVITGGLMGDAGSITLSNSYWDICRTNQTTCVSGGSPSGCTGKNNVTNPDDKYFYKISNQPMASWSYPAWNTNCNNTGYQTLDWQGNVTCKKSIGCTTQQSETVPETSNKTATVIILLAVVVIAGILLFKKR